MHHAATVYARRQFLENRLAVLQGSATNSPAFSGGGTSSPLAPLSPLAAEGGRVLLTTGLPEATPHSSGVGSGGRSSPRQSLEEMRARLSHLKEAIQAQTVGQVGHSHSNAVHTVRASLQSPVPAEERVWVGMPGIVGC